MKLNEIVIILMNPQGVDSIYQRYDTQRQSETLLIYMEKEISISSETIIFSIEETNDEVIFFQKDVKYVQLFPVDYVAELIESDLELSNKGLTSYQIAERLIEYRVRDA